MDHEPLREQKPRGLLPSFNPISTQICAEALSDYSFNLVPNWFRRNRPTIVWKKCSWCAGLRPQFISVERPELSDRGARLRTLSLEDSRNAAQSQGSRFRHY